MAYDPLRDEVAKLWDWPEFSDFEIRCGEKKAWRVHKFVVGLQSEYFKRAMRNGFKESHDGVLDLSDDDPDTVNAVLRWFYKRDYENKSITASMLPFVDFHMRVFQLADKYLVSGLKDTAAKKLGVLCKASDLSAHSEAFANAIVPIYNMPASSNKAMREVIMNIVHTHKKELFDVNNTKTARFREVLRYPELCGFAADVAARLASTS